MWAGRLVLRDIGIGQFDGEAIAGEPVEVL